MVDGIQERIDQLVDDLGINDGGTPNDESDDCGVITLVGPPPASGGDWQNYSADIPFMSESMPLGWRTSDAGRGRVGIDPDEAWNMVIENVSQVRICWEQCDWFRIQCDWALEIDNIATDATRP